jgi:hypothetical protein
MVFKSINQLSAEIDQAVHPDGPLGKTTAGSLNTVLKSLASELVDQQSATPDLSHKADLDSSGRVPSSQLPSYVDDIVEAARFVALPTPGEAGKVYVTLDTNQQYRWAGSTYALLSDSGLTVDLKAALEASQNPSASNAFVTQAEVASSSNRYADIVSLTRTRTYYDTITDVVVASQAGDTINLYAPIFAAPTQSAEAFIDLKPGVNINIYGVRLTSGDTGHDILTFRGGTSIVNGYHSTITQNPTANGGGWFIGTYDGLPVDADATINDLNLDLVTYNSVGFALYGNGTYRYRGNITSAGRYVVKVAAKKATTSFQGEGTIYQTGTGYIFWLFSGTSLSWRGDITARDSSTMLLEAGTVTLREGILHAQQRTAGAEKVVTRTSADSTLILENYAVLGVVGTTVIEADTVILRGNTVVIGNIVATTILDERPPQANVVHTTGDETIAGVKGFTDHVGIGTSTPAKALHLSMNESGGGRGMLIQNANNLGYSEVIFNNDVYQDDGSFVFGYGGTGTQNPNEAYFYNRRAARIIFGTNNQTRLTITADGAVGIGTDNPSQKLEVVGNVKAAAFIGDGSQLTGIAPIVTVEQNLTSRSTTTVPSVAAVQTAITNAVTVQTSNWRNHLTTNVTLTDIVANNTPTSYDGWSYSDNNIFGAGMKNNKIDKYYVGNYFGANFQNNTLANNSNFNTFEPGITYCTFATAGWYGRYGAGMNNCNIGAQNYYLTIGPGCQYVTIGDNCQYVEVYNCKGTSAAPFVIPANTRNAIYRNNALVGPDPAAVVIEQNLTSNSATSVPSVAAVKAAIAAGGDVIPLAGTTPNAPVTGTISLNEDGAVSFYDVTNDWYVKLTAGDGLHMQFQDSNHNELSEISFAVDGIIATAPGASYLMNSPDGLHQISLTASNTGKLLVNGAEIGGGGSSVTVEQNLSSNSTTNVPSVAAVKTAVAAAVTLPPMIIDLVGYQYQPIPTVVNNTGLASSIVIGSNFVWDSAYAAGKTVQMEICSSATAGKHLAASLYTLDGVNVANSGISGFSSEVGLARTGTFALVHGTTYQVRIAVGSSGTGYLYSARLIIK